MVAQRKFNSLTLLALEFLLMSVGSTPIEELSFLPSRLSEYSGIRLRFYSLDLSSHPKETLDEVSEYFRSSLHVRPLVSPVVLPSYLHCGGGTELPPDISSIGVSSDLLIILSEGPTRWDSCLIEPEPSYQVLVGYLSLPKESPVQTLIEGVFRILGLSPDLVPYFQKEEGGFYSAEELLVNFDGQSIARSPSMAKKTEELFGCSDLANVFIPLEGPPIVEDFDVFSYLSFAFLNDSGWYSVNWEKVTPIKVNSVKCARNLQTCPENCSDCNVDGYCSQCASGFSLRDDNVCVEGCSWHTNCKVCSMGGYNCEECYPGYTLTASNCINIPCENDQSCQVCTKNSRCDLCYESLNMDTGACESECTSVDNCMRCPDGVLCEMCDANYNVSPSGSCENNCDWIDPNCSMCNRWDCSQCTSPYYLDSKNKCKVGCPEIENCAVCSDGENCTECDTDYSYDTEAKKCMSECNWVRGCLKCNELTCLECQEGFSLNSWGLADPCGDSCNTPDCDYCRDGTCSKCSYGKSLDSNKSCNDNCDLPDCEICSAGDVCDICMHPKSRSEAGSCSETCSTIENCEICQDGEMCNTCASGYYPTGLGDCKTGCASIDNCNRCVDESICDECEVGYTLMTGHSETEFNGKCLIGCLNTMNCSECDANSQCTGCYPGYSYDPSSMTCSIHSSLGSCSVSADGINCDICLTGFYLNSSNICSLIQDDFLNCEQVENGACVKCFPGLSLSSAGQCEGECTTIPDCLICSDRYTCDNCGKNGLDSNKQCTKVCTAENCETCHAVDFCSACKDSYSLINYTSSDYYSRCFSSCPSILNCQECVNGICTKCFKGYSLNGNYCDSYGCSNISNCLSCPDGNNCETCFTQFYLDDTGNCQTGCGLSGCFECRDGTNCELCDGDKSLGSDSQCYDQCDWIDNCKICLDTSICGMCNDGFYLYYGICRPKCTEISNCNECPDTSQCSLCETWYTLNSTGGCEISVADSPYCILYLPNGLCGKCDDGYHFDSEGNCVENCMAIDPYCETCSDLTICDSCVYGFFPGTTLCKPPSCHDLYCAECEEDYNVCDQCIGRLSLSGGTCAVGCEWLYGCLACTDGVTCDLQVESSCTAISDCMECSGTECLRCASGKSITASNTCSEVECDILPNCKVCPLAHQCEECAEGYYVDHSGSCKRGCEEIPDCKQCANPSICDECDDGFSKSLVYDRKVYDLCSPVCHWIQNCEFCPDQTTCQTCLAGYSLSSDKTTCREYCETITDCSTCSDSVNCDLCYSGRSLNANKQCDCACNTIENCYECRDGASCDTCISGFSLDSSGQCSSSCTWISNCKVCVEDTCEECEDGYSWDSSENLCREGCLQANCEECFLASSCEKCAATYSKNTEVFQEYYDVCRSVCHWKNYCVECNEADECVLCMEGFSLEYPYSTDPCHYTCSRVSECSVCRDGETCDLCMHGCNLTPERTCSSAVQTSDIPNCDISRDGVKCDTCSAGYNLNLDDQCVPGCSWIANCEECQKDVCNICSSGYSFTNWGGCQEECPHIANCKRCNDKEYCDECETGFSRNYMTNEFVQQCDDTCHWIRGCKKCSDGYQCEECIEDYELVDPFTCNYGCWSIINCSICSDSTKCEKCVAGFSLMLDGQCHDLYICENDTNCRICSDGSSCEECSDSYSLSENMTCEEECTWIENCTRCNKDMCTLCDSGYYVTQRGTCANSCPTIPNCNECTDPTICLNCTDGYYLNDERPAGVYYQCAEICHWLPNCKKCNDSVTCLECVSGFSLQGNTCETMCWSISNCLVCEDGVTCSECLAGFSLTSDTQCEEKCDSFSNCSICPSDNCERCLSGFSLTDTSECTSSCPHIPNCSVCRDGFTCDECIDLFYPNIYGACVEDCVYIPNCKRCMNMVDCDECEAGFSLNTFSADDLYRNKCEDTCHWIQYCQICPDGTNCEKCHDGFSIYDNGNIIQCDLSCGEIENCQVCSTKDTCEFCVADYSLQNGQCARTCPIANCEWCPDGVKCDRCDETYSLEGGQCLDTCSLSNCNACRHGTVCDECAEGFYLANEGCKQGCPEIDHCVKCSTQSHCEECEAGYSLDYTHTNEQYRICKESCHWIQGCAECPSNLCEKCYYGFTLFDHTYDVTCDAGAYSTLEFCELSSDGARCDLCMHGYSLDTVEGTCSYHCSSLDNCSTCRNGTECDGCTNSYSMTAENTCVDNCDWITNCAYCSQSEYCSTCKENFYLNQDGNCVDNCEAISNCKKCWSDSMCDECDSDYFLDPNNNCVDKCHWISYCESCTFTECLLCIQGYTLTSYGMCEPMMCDSVNNCERCRDGISCDTCIIEFKKNDQGQCVLGCDHIPHCCSCRDDKCLYCSDQFNLTPQGTCEDTCTAINNCRSCRNGTSCDECDDGFYTDNNGYCQSTCNTIDNCEKCIDSTQCNVCEEGYSDNFHELERYNRKCSKNCNYISNCLECVSEEAGCKKCHPGHSLVDSTCQQTCELSYCETCSDGANCDSCMWEFSLSDNQCIDNCDWIDGCKYCRDGTQCDYCKEGYGLTPELICTPGCPYRENCKECKSSGGVCDVCNDGYFWGPHNTCISSGPIDNCIEYSDNLTCIKCAEGYNMYDETTCVEVCHWILNCDSCTNGLCDRCSDGYNYDMFNLSNPCSTYTICQTSNCEQCREPGSCEYCMVGWSLSADGLCVDTCAAVENCDYCQNGTDCDYCKEGFSLNSAGECVSTGCSWLNNCTECRDGEICSVCEDGFYFGDNGHCDTGCIYFDNCEYCRNSNYCDVCADTYFIDSNNPSACTKYCPNIPYCKKCIDSHQCEECHSGYSLESNTCTPHCYMAFDCLVCSNDICTYCMIGKSLLSDGSCGDICPSDDNCEYCPDGNKCAMCKTGYSLTSEGTCVDECTLFDKCSECSDGRSCNMCNSGYSNYNGRCEKECDLENCQYCNEDNTCKYCDFEYRLNSSGECVPGCSNCEFCGINQKCMQCFPGFYFSADYSCLEICPSDPNCLCLNDECKECLYGESSPGVCAPNTCPEYCEACSGGVCTKCLRGYTMTGGVCFLNMDYSSACLSSPDGITCEICRESIDASGQCASECGSVPDCQTCSFQGVCDVCQPNFSLNQDGTCGNSTSLANCNYSTNGSTCDECSTGMYWSNWGGCVSECPFITNCKQCSVSDICDLCEDNYSMNPYMNEASEICSEVCVWISGCEICDMMSCSLALEGYSLDQNGVPTLNYNYCVDEINCPFPDCEESRTGTECGKCKTGFSLTADEGCTAGCPIDGCQECQDGVHCEICEANKSLNADGVCADSCDWIENCERCSKSICEVCETDYYLDGSGGCKTGCSINNCNECSSSNMCEVCEATYSRNSEHLPQRSWVSQCQPYCHWVLNCKTCDDFGVCTECFDQFELDSNSTCVAKCTPECSECNDTQCTKCKTGFSLNNGVCENECTSVAGCMNCRDGANCETCQADYSLTIDYKCENQCSTNDSCKTCIFGYCTSCENDFYMNSRGECVQGCATLPNCDKCYDPVTCDECAVGYSKDPYQTVSKFTCQEICHWLDRCEECSDSYTCTRCLPGYSLNESYCEPWSAIVDDCEVRQDGTNCSLCVHPYSLQADFSCAMDCSSIDNCSICLDGNTCDECMPNYHVNFGGTCTDVCDIANCEVCYRGVCETCASGFYLSRSGACVDSCTTIDNCDRCYNPSICDECSEGYISDSYQIYEFEPCIPIEYTKLHCKTFSIDKICTECYKGYSLDISEQYSPCDYHCSNLSDCNICADGLNCDECYSHRNNNNGTCVDLCPLENCENCPVQGECEQCQGGFSLSIDKQCTDNCDWIDNCQTCRQTQCETCQEGFYLSGKGCKPCSDYENCAECTSGSCTRCQDGYSLMQMPYSACVSVCSWLFDCKTCEDGNVCSECFSGYYLDTGSLQCEMMCWSMPNCSICTDNNICTKCNQGYSLDDGACNYSCPLDSCQECRDGIYCENCDSGFSRNSNGECVTSCDWIDNCQECDNDTCQICESGFYLTEWGGCQTSCPYFENCEECYNASYCDRCKPGFSRVYHRIGDLQEECQPTCHWKLHCSSCSDGSTCESCYNEFSLEDPYSDYPCHPSCISQPDCYACRDSNSCHLCDHWESLDDGVCGNTCSLDNCTQCRDGENCNACASGFSLSPDQQCESHCDWIQYCSICSNGKTCDLCIGDVPPNAYNQCEFVCSVDNCETCKNDGSCEMCNEGFSLTLDGNCSADDCPSINQCAVCRNGSVCDACRDLHVFYDVTNACEPQCGDITSCKICTNASACDICEDSYTAIGNECLMVCDTLDNCQRCSDPAVCDLCFVDFSLNGALCSSDPCVSVDNCFKCRDGIACDECNNDFYKNSKAQCEPQCSEVDNCSLCLSSSECEQCLSDFSLDLNDRSCSVTCPSNSDCQVCNNGTECDKCKSDLSLSSSKECESVCSELLGCKVCGDGSTCDLCETQHSLNNGLCSSEDCLENSSCQFCPDGSMCEVCKDPLSLSSSGACEESCELPNCQLCKDGETCDLCDSGDFRLSSRGVCEAIFATIPNCSESSDGNVCSKCLSDFSWNPDNQTCDDTCHMTNCDVCNDGETCDECSLGFSLSLSSECESECDRFTDCEDCRRSDKCDKCVEGKSLREGECYESCSSIENCGTCEDGETCSSCKENFSLSLDGVCGSSCAIEGCETCRDGVYCDACSSGYYKNSSDECQIECSSVANCKLCSLSTECDECFDPFSVTYEFLCDTPCESVPNCKFCASDFCYECDDSFAMTSLGECSSCSTIDNCLLCSVSTYCDQCFKDFNPISSNSYCSSCSSIENCLECESGVCSSCVDGFEVSNGECSSCSTIDKCLVCEDDSICTSCHSESELTSKGECKTCGTVSNCLRCDSGTCGECEKDFELTTEFECDSCSDIENCLVCENTSVCESCKVGYSINPSGSCDFKCSTVSNCTQCPDGNNCTVCDQYYFLSSGSCTSCSQVNSRCVDCSDGSTCTECVDTYFPEGQNCFECSLIPNCLDCSDLQTCTVCEGLHYLKNGSCLSCSQSPNLPNCIDCLDENTCTECNPFYFVDSGVCESCMTGCYTCTNLSECSECNTSEHFIKTIDNQCECAEGYYLENGICVECVPGCKECDNVSGCIACMDEYYLNSISLCELCNDSLCKTCPNNECSVCQSNSDFVEGRCECNSGHCLLNDLCLPSCTLCTSDQSTQDCLCKDNTITTHTGQETDLSQFCSCQDTYELVASQCVPRKKYLAVSDISRVYFNKHYTKLKIEFNIKTTAVKLPCGDLLLADTVSKLGSNPECAWANRKKLQITLDDGYTLRESDIIYLNAFNIEKNASEDPTYNYVELLKEITHVHDYPVPRAGLSRPRTYSVECTEEPLELIGSCKSGQASNDPSFSWTVEPADDSTVVNPDLITYLSTYTQADMTIEKFYLDNYGGEYKFTVSVSNIYNQQGSKTKRVKIKDQAALSIKIQGDDDTEFKQSEKKVVKATVQKRCKAKGRPNYSWEYVPQASDINLSVDPSQVVSNLGSTKQRLKVKPNDLEAGYSYTYRVTAVLGDYSATEDVTFDIVYSDLVAIMNLEDQEVSANSPLSLDASESYDPDNRGEMAYLWTCKFDDESGSECLGSDNLSLIPSTDRNREEFTIPADRLPSGSALYLNLTVSSDTRSSTDLATVTVKDQEGEGTVELLQHFYFKINPHWELFIIIFTDGYSIEWTQLEGDPVLPIVSMNGAFLRFPAYSMAEGMLFTLSALISFDWGTLELRLSWTTNMGPSCGDNAIAPKTIDDLPYLSIEGCYDRDEEDIPLLYSYGIFWRRFYIGSTPMLESPEVLFPVSGRFTVVVEVCDKLFSCIWKINDVVFSRVRELQSSTIIAQYEEDKLEDDLIPLLIIVFSEQFELSASDWSYMYQDLSTYISSVDEFNEPTVTGLLGSCAALLLEFSGNDATSVKNAISLLDSIVNSAEQKLPSDNLQLLVDSYEEVMVQFNNQTDVMQAVISSLQNTNKKQIEGLATGDNAIQTIGANSTFASRIQRYSGDSLSNRVISIDLSSESFEISLPSLTALTSRDVVDLEISIMPGSSSSSHLVDVVFYSSGSTDANGISLSLTSSQVMKFSNLSEPINITLPFTQDTNLNYGCFVYEDPNWIHDEECLVILTNTTATLQTRHTSIFKLDSVPNSGTGKSDCDSSYTGLFIASSIIVAFVFLVVSKIILRYRRKQIDPPHRITRIIELSSPDKMVPDETVVMPTEMALPGPKGHFTNHHLVLGQFKESHIPTFMRSVQLLNNVFANYAFAALAILAIEETGLYSTYKSLSISDYLLLAAISAFMACVVGILIEIGLVPWKACKGRAKNLNWVHLGFWSIAGIAGTGYFSVVACHDWIMSWNTVFGLALLMDLVILQSLIAFIKNKITFKAENKYRSSIGF